MRTQERSPYGDSLDWDLGDKNVQRQIRRAERKHRAQQRREEVARKRLRRPEGRHAGRAYHRLRVPAHRETTASIEALYPFLAESGLDGTWTYIGRDMTSGSSFSFDVFGLYDAGLLENPNGLIAGNIGSSKSSLAKTMGSRAAAFGVRNVVPSDSKGEYKETARMHGCEPIYLGQGLSARLNPLDAPSRPPGLEEDVWATQVRTNRLQLLGALVETAMDRTHMPRLTPEERTGIRIALDAVTREAYGASPGRVAVPLLAEVAEAMFQPDDQVARDNGFIDGRALLEASRQAALTLKGDLIGGALSGMFDGHSTVRLDFDQPYTVIDLSSAQASDDALALIMTCSQAAMEAALMRQDGIRRLIWYDECWRLMKFASLVRRLSAQQKMARQWGCSNWLVMHKLKDLLGADASVRDVAEGLIADTEVRVVYRQSEDQLNTTQQILNLTDVERGQVGKLSRAQALWRIKDQGFLVRHVVPRTGLEWPMVQTDSKMKGEADTSNEEIVGIPGRDETDDEAAVTTREA